MVSCEQQFCRDCLLPHILHLQRQHPLALPGIFVQVKGYVEEAGSNGREGLSQTESDTRKHRSLALAQGKAHVVVG